MGNHNGETKDSSENQLLSELKVADLALYYDEMVRSHLVELEVESPAGKIVLKRKQTEKELSYLQRRKNDSTLVFSDPVRTLPEQPAVASDVPMIKSPIMGTFYRSSSPQSAPFVKEGDTVNSGSTLCIVEAMKVMNEIKADSRCKIIKICVENGKPIAKGDPLFHIEMS